MPAVPNGTAGPPYSVNTDSTVRRFEKTLGTKPTWLSLGSIADNITSMWGDSCEIHIKRSVWGAIIYNYLNQFTPKFIPPSRPNLVTLVRGRQHG